MASSRVPATHFVDGMTPEQAQRARSIELPVFVAVGLVIPALILNSVDPRGALGVLSDVLNWGIWLTFLAEFVVMLRIAPDNRAWLRHNVLDVAVLVLTPPFLPEPLHVLWVLRLLRILDLMPVAGAVFKFNAFRYAAILAFLAIIGGGIAYTELEDRSDVDQFDGIWWAMTTISTVGYGDQFPETTPGRIVGMGLMVLGPVLIGLVATGVGAMVSRQIERDLAAVTGDLREEVDDVEEQVDEVQEDVQELREIDRQILQRLDAIAERLDALERRAAS
jgi:voltage-gated potassium channel